jgi:antirestriction protein ArdC
VKLKIELSNGGRVVSLDEFTKAFLETIQRARSSGIPATPDSRHCRKNQHPPPLSRTWNELGRFVKKGEKGILILAPIVRRKSPTEAEQEQYSASIAGFRAAYVFDLSQTDGTELPQIATVHGDPKEHTERLRSFASTQGMVVEYSEQIAPAHGVSSGGKITLLPGQSAPENLSTLAHELAHELLHRDNRRVTTSRRIRETEAEATAFVVCHAVGLETGSAACDYIQLWNGDAQLLTESLAHILSLAKMMIDFEINSLRTGL